MRKKLLAEEADRVRRALHEAARENREARRRVRLAARALTWVIEHPPVPSSKKSSQE